MSIDKDALGKNEKIGNTSNEGIASVEVKVVNANEFKVSGVFDNSNNKSIENVEINKTIIDILEGTKPALRNRTSKYSLV